MMYVQCDLYYRYGMYLKNMKVKLLSLNVHFEIWNCKLQIVRKSDFKLKNVGVQDKDAVVAILHYRGGSDQNKLFFSATQYFQDARKKNFKIWGYQHF